MLADLNHNCQPCSQTTNTAYNIKQIKETCFWLLPFAQGITTAGSHAHLIWQIFMPDALHIVLYCEHKRLYGGPRAWQLHRKYDSCPCLQSSIIPAMYQCFNSLLSSPEVTIDVLLKTRWKQAKSTSRIAFMMSYTCTAIPNFHIIWNYMLIKAPFINFNNMYSPQFALAEHKRDGSSRF